MPYNACNIQQPVVAGDPDDNGMRWYTYVGYLNFDNPPVYGNPAFHQLGTVGNNFHVFN